MSDYHSRIMNIPAGNPETVPYHFKKGHQNARHAAAEIATEADAEIESLRSRLAAAEEKLHRIRRMGELSAAIMRDPERTGGWSGSERVARGFERIAHLAGEKHE
jgi:hypothetical protein